MNYNAKYFRDSIPDWKKKKDPVLSRFFYRPVSFYCSALATKLGISANTISYFSGVLGIIACLLFLPNNFICKLVGAVLINVWLILDCTDGNIARNVKKQPFGEFADGISSYILVALMCIVMGFSVYQSGGILFTQGNPWIILIGAFASSSDTMMRLIYQKYQSTAKDMIDMGIIPGERDLRTDHNSVGSFRVRVEAELGIGGILPIAILISTIFNALDLIVLYCFIYYGVSCIISTLLFVQKAIKASKNPLKEMM